MRMWVCSNGWKLISDEADVTATEEGSWFDSTKTCLLMTEPKTGKLGCVRLSKVTFASTRLLVYRHHLMFQQDIGDKEVVSAVAFELSGIVLAKRLPENNK